MLKLRVHIPDIYFSSILFGPGFLSSVAHLLSVENRLVMLLFMPLIMIFSNGCTYFYLRDKRIQSFLISGHFLSCWFSRNYRVFWSNVLVVGNVLRFWSDASLMFLRLLPLK